MELDTNGIPSPGPAYDYRDELLAGIQQFRETREVSPPIDREMAVYQPTPVRQILRLITAGRLSENDVLVDLGSGLRHVPLLAWVLTGAEGVGIEVEPAYVATALESARSLFVQNRVHFHSGDARTGDLARGTVF